MASDLHRSGARWVDTPKPQPSAVWTVHAPSAHVGAEHAAIVSGPLSSPITSVGPAVPYSPATHRTHAARVADARAAREASVSTVLWNVPDSSADSPVSCVVRPDARDYCTPFAAATVAMVLDSSGVAHTITRPGPAELTAARDRAAVLASSVT